MRGLYEASLLGTPLSLLQIPPRAVHGVQEKTSDPSAGSLSYTQDSGAVEACPGATPARLDVGYVCKKCHMVYPGAEACAAHQSAVCYPSGQPRPERPALKLEQVLYKCEPCAVKCNTRAEYEAHRQTPAHAQQTQ